jgi:hypothetical protein
VPSAPDHYRFALDVLASIPGAPVARRGLILIGTQGPDPFFFFGEVPWRRRKGKDRADALGEFLHASDPLPVFESLGRIAAGTPVPEREDACAYLYGLLLHYVLDRTLHPYVFYRSGFDARGGLSGRYGFRHALFETMLAEVGRGGVPASETSPRRMFSADPRELTAADRLWAAGFPDLAAPGCFRDAWADMTTTLRTLWDPLGIKRRAVKAVFGAESKAFALVRPREQDDDIDYRNEQRVLWLHPVSGAESDAGTAELLQQAGAEARTALAFVEIIRRGGHPGWESFFDGVNHDGNRPGETRRLQRSVYDRQ